MPRWKITSVTIYFDRDSVERINVVGEWWRASWPLLFAVGRVKGCGVVVVPERFVCYVAKIVYGQRMRAVE
jgi:hypothetical protein